MIKVMRCNLDMLQHAMRGLEEDGHTVISVAGYTQGMPDIEVHGMAIIYREVEVDHG